MQKNMFFVVVLALRLIVTEIFLNFYGGDCCCVDLFYSWKGLKDNSLAIPG